MAMDRRTFLQAGAAATALSAIDLGGVARAAAPAADYTLGFQSTREEIRVDGLPVSGRLPAWLRGTLVRNGPGQFEVGERTFNHWFDGLAMLHAFSFERGRVGYANRFLRSSAYEAAVTEGKIRYSEFATDPCREIFNGAQAMFVPAPVPNANVNIARLGRRFVALTEIPLPVSFDPATLDTLGVEGPTPGVGELRTAHPHVDPITGERFTFETKLIPPSRYVVYRNEKVLAELPEAEPAYIHSFGLTRRFVVLAEFPFAIDPLSVLAQWKPVIENYRWTGRPSRFHLIDRRSGRRAASIEADPFFAFHHVNAFERDDQVIVDLCAYDDAEVIRALYLDRLRAPGNRVPTARPRRYVLDPDRGTARVRPLAGGTIELPRVNAERIAQPYRYAYGVGLRDTRRSRFVDRLVKLDVEGGRPRTWEAPGCFPGEPVFVAAPGARAEDDGVVLSVVLDTRAATSFLLVLDARSLAERARATVPHSVAFGFHGAFLGA